MTDRPPPLVTVRACRYGDPDAARLVEEVQEEYVRRFGSPDLSPLTPQDFQPPEGTFLLGYVDEVPVASAAFRRTDAADDHGAEADAGDPPSPLTAEIKRMYVVPHLRGSGVAQVMLTDLEQRAAASGYGRLVLETAEQLPEARRLYEKAGYTRIEPFGYYREFTDVRCYAKDL